MEATALTMHAGSERRGLTLRKVLLACGVLSSLLYAGADVLGVMRWEGYSYASQAMSELRAIGAPSRPLVVPLFTAYSVLVIGFGVGVWGASTGKRALRFMGGLLIAFGALDLVGPFVPMHLRGAEMTLTDVMHIALTSADVLFIVLLLAVGSGTTAFGKPFRLYSMGTLLTVVVVGTLAALDGSRLAAGQPTPWLGVTERICVGAYLAWALVLAVVLLRAETRNEAAPRHVAAWAGPALASAASAGPSSRHVNHSRTTFAPSDS
jgi:hypothetical protein